MGKILQEPKGIIIAEQNGVFEITLRYAVSSEEYPDLYVQRDLPITELTPQEQSVVTQILGWATAKMKNAEGIT